jgi:UDP-N-acetylmuramoyl-tripeptide--D-alanyl-D-alanine ligase
MQGEVLAGSTHGAFDGVALDSRRVRGGELFFAFPGARVDGHDFVVEAARRGARGAVVMRPVELGPELAGRGEFALIRVADPERALHELVRVARKRLPEHLVAVTGSAGKTTTKELLARLLALRYRVAASPGNLNNLLGFPLALLGIPDDTQWMVAEMAMSEPGELRRMSELGRPDAAIFTNVRPVHLAGFERPGRPATLRDIAEAKAELLAGLDPRGLVVANAADPEVVRIAERHEHRGGRVAWFALDQGAAARTPRLTVRGLASELDEASGAPRSRFELVDGSSGASVAVELPLHGRVNVENFLAAATAAVELGVPLEQLPSALRDLSGAAGRGRVLRLAIGALLVDDCYNSNPDALRHALQAAAELPGARRWAVLGDMLELGADAGEHHRRLGREAARLGFSPLLGVGALAHELLEAAAGAGAQTVKLPTAAAAAARAAEELRAGDVVLVKGSRGVGLEAVVQRLVADGAVH